MTTGALTTDVLLSLLSSLIWRLAQRTPQFRARHELWARLYAALNRDVVAQQKANRVKRRKLAGLRLARRRAAVQWRITNDLNIEHCAFVNQLERDHPEMRAQIVAHHERRSVALHPTIPPSP